MTHQLWAHLPTPFAPANSTVLTVVDQLSREAERRGQPSVVLGEEWQLRRIDPARRRSVLASPRVRSGYLGSGEWIGRIERAADIALGTALHRRPFAERMYDGALATAGELTSAQLFLHDASLGFCGIRPARARLPEAGVYLYSHVPISRSVARGELRALLARVNAHICVSADLANRTTARGSVADKTVVVPNAVDTSAFSPQVAGLAPQPVVIWSGELAPQKGVGLLIDAVGRIPERVGCTLRIVGDASYAKNAGYASALRKQAAECRNEVEFLGTRPHGEMPSHLRKARVFCLPSPANETFGLSLLEAMACGLACIASPHGGIAEVGGDAVVYVEPTSTDEMANAIEWLLTDDAAAADLGRRARVRAETFGATEQLSRLAGVVSRFG